MFAGAGGLDRRVERQQVRLIGQRVDRLDHDADLRGDLAELADLGGGVGDPALDRAHVVDRFRDRFRAVLGGRARSVAVGGESGGDPRDTLDVAGHALRVGGSGTHLHRLIDRAARDPVDRGFELPHDDVGCFRSGRQIGRTRGQLAYGDADAADDLGGA